VNGNFLGLGNWLLQAATAAADQRHLLEAAAVIVRDHAVDKLGTYQPAVGPYPAWAPLAQETQNIRAAQGYTPDDPLLRSGEMRDSIGYEVSTDYANIGSSLMKALYQELGTSTHPPRPFFGPAGLESEQEVLDFINVTITRFF
jgi:phage gpG-like protein